MRTNRTPPPPPSSPSPATATSVIERYLPWQKIGDLRMVLDSGCVAVARRGIGRRVRPPPSGAAPMWLVEAESASSFSTRRRRPLRPKKVCHSAFGRSGPCGRSAPSDTSVIGCIIHFGITVLATAVPSFGSRVVAAMPLLAAAEAFIRSPSRVTTARPILPNRIRPQPGLPRICCFAYRATATYVLL